MKALGFCVVESPNTANTSTKIVIKFGMIANPNANDIALELFKFIGITFWCFVIEFNNHSLFQELEDQSLFGGL